MAHGLDHQQASRSGRRDEAFAAVACDTRTGILHFAGGPLSGPEWLRSCLRQGRHRTRMRSVDVTPLGEHAPNAMRLAAGSTHWPRALSVSTSVCAIDQGSPFASAAPRGAAPASPGAPPDEAPIAVMVEPD